MKSNLIGLLLLSVGGFSWSLLPLGLSGLKTANAEPSNRQHFWTRVPARELSCEAEAQALATRFAASHPQVDVMGVCLGQAEVRFGGILYPFFAIEIEYPSQVELVPYTAIFGGGGSDSVPRTHRGAYDTLQDCLADLDGQSQLFREKTGLIPASATCEKGSSFTFESVVLKITGWGNPSTRLYASGEGFEGLLPETFWQGVLDLIRLEGGTVVHQRGSEALYYAETPARLQSHAFHSFRVPAQCKNQLLDAESILKGAGATSLVLACIPSSTDLGSSTVTLRAVTRGAFFLRSDYAEGSPTYDSFEECQRDKPRLLERSKSHGRASLGAVCRSSGRAQGEFVVEIYGGL